MWKFCFVSISINCGNQPRQRALPSGQCLIFFSTFDWFQREKSCSLLLAVLCVQGTEMREINWTKEKWLTPQCHEIKKLPKYTYHYAERLHDKIRPFLFCFVHWELIKFKKFHSCDEEKNGRKARFSFFLCKSVERVERGEAIPCRWLTFPLINNNLHDKNGKTEHPLAGSSTLSLCTFPLHSGRFRLGRSYSEAKSTRANNECVGTRRRISAAFEDERASLKRRRIKVKECESVRQSRSNEQRNNFE